MVKTASDTNRSRGVWSRGEGSKETISGMLEGTKLSAAVKSAEDKFFGGTKPEDTAMGRCVKGAYI